MYDFAGPQAIGGLFVHSHLAGLDVVESCGPQGYALRRRRSALRKASSQSLADALYRKLMTQRHG